jgi:hypothetical protein
VFAFSRAGDLLIASSLFASWHCEGDNFVGVAMIRPETFALKSEGAALERDSRQLFDLWLCFARIQARNPPIALALLGAAEDIDQAIDENMAAYFRVDRNFAQRVSLRIELEDPMLVPLAQVEMFAIVAQVRAGKIRTRDPIRLGESPAPHVAPEITIVLLTFAEGKPNIISRGNGSPWNAGRFFFSGNRPPIALDSINAPEIARSHPELAPIPGERLGRYGRRRQPLSFSDDR